MLVLESREHKYAHDMSLLPPRTTIVDFVFLFRRRLSQEPYFGERGGKARFCATHKPDTSMVDVRHRR